MSVKLYMDHHVPGAVTEQLRIYGLDVLTAEDDHAERRPDSFLMDRATALGRTLVSQDEDLLAEAALRQRGRIAFSGLIYAHQLEIQIGKFIGDLRLICEVCEAAELANMVIYLPI